ncbi:hypothetical protein K0651_04350 [Ornithinimicrobium sp. Arc0846-15]|nr:hypothetical protein [Ornithinimicrobium laminariae]
MSISLQERESITQAIGGYRPTRRGLVAGAGVFSVPAIAMAVAAPVMAQSADPICGGCGETRNCFLALGDPGGCACEGDLVCVGSGPLGLVNLCVGTDLVLTDCGGSQCTGVCADAGGTLLTALNTLAAGISVLGVLGQTVTVNLPEDLCVSPFGDGSLGTVCNTAQVGGILGVAINGLINTALNVITGLGLVVGGECQDGLSCEGVNLDGVLSTSGSIGFCSCS